jgi:hypothetical protein
VVRSPVKRVLIAVAPPVSGRLRKLPTSTNPLFKSFPEESFKRLKVSKEIVAPIVGFDWTKKRAVKRRYAKKEDFRIEKLSLLKNRYVQEPDII